MNQRRRYRRMAAAGTAFVVAACLAGGCDDPKEKVPPARVATVTAYGLTLDESATPQQVTYVLLRSLQEDVRAAQARPPRHDDQKQANLITWSIAAPNVIERRLLETLRQHAKTPERHKSLGADRDKEIYRVVNLWAPIVAYYVDSFFRQRPGSPPETDLQQIMARMNQRNAPDGKIAHVEYEVWPDPARPDAARHQVLDIELVKDQDASDPKEYWRVARVAYKGQGARSATRPADSAATKPE